MTRQNGVGQRNAGFGRAGLGVFQAANSSVVRSVSQESGVRTFRVRLLFPAVWYVWRRKAWIAKWCSFSLARDYGSLTSKALSPLFSPSAGALP
jgi:hypothetical protein